MPGLSVLRVSCALTLGTLFLPPAAQAASFTVQNGQTVGAQWLADSGDTGTIEKGGTISTSDPGAPGFGVTSASDHNTVNNYGTVSTNADGAYGIYSAQDYFTVNNAGAISGAGTQEAGIYGAGAYAVLRNSGIIQESGTGAEGIHSDGDYADILNTGSLISSGDVPMGIYSSGDHATINNRGSISVTGSGAYGILSFSLGGGVYGNDATINNYGDIKVFGDEGATGIYSVGNAANIDNRGSIETVGDTSYAIISVGDNATIVSRGSISTSGSFAEGILTFGDNTNLTISGAVISTGNEAFALDIQSLDTTVTLLAGTALQGGIYFNHSPTNTLNIGTGLNTALTFYSPTDVPTTNTNGQPYVVDSALLAVVDPTGLAAANSFAFDLSRSIADTAEARMTAPDAAGLTTGALPGQSAPRGDYWTAGLGFYGDHAAQDSLDGYHDGAAGLMFGADRALSAATTAGLFGGFSAGAIGTDAGSTNINAVGAFAGGYWSHDDGKTFTHVSLTGGGLDNTSNRTVTNNLVNGGLETASAEYRSFYASPALTLGLHQRMGDATLSPSVGLRYAGLYRGGYTESGSAADVTADSGTAQALDVRGELRSDFAAAVSDAGVGRLNLRAGVDGIFTWGGAVDGELLGTDITPLSGGQQSVARGYLGAGATFTGMDGAVFNGTVTASYDTADTFAIAAQAGMNRAF
jgi:hypothetical protein